MKRFVALSAVTFMTLGLWGSNSTFAASSTVRLTAHLKGSNEVSKKGPVHGTGTAVVRINLTKNQLCYTLAVSGFKLPAVAAHIHSGGAGKEGPIVVPFPTFPGRTGRAAGCTTARASLLKGIANHPASYYVNVHTAAYPGGAVRGQLGM